MSLRHGKRGNGNGGEVKEEVHRYGEMTGKIAVVMKEEYGGDLEGLFRFMKRSKGILLLMIGLIVLGFGASAYIAKPQDVFSIKKATLQLQTSQQEQDKRISHIEAEQSTHVEMHKALEDDLHFQRTQLWEIARRVGARRVSAPAHASSEETP